MKQKEEHQPPEKKLRAVCKSSDTARKDGNENQIYLKFTSSTDTAQEYSKALCELLLPFQSCFQQTFNLQSYSSG